MTSSIDGPALKRQVGGSHYKSMAIQPVEFIVANGLGFCEGNAIKYVCRYKTKNGVEDLRKAIHYLELLIENIERGDSPKGHTDNAYVVRFKCALTKAGRKARYPHIEQQKK